MPRHDASRMGIVEGLYSREKQREIVGSSPTKRRFQSLRQHARHCYTCQGTMLQEWELLKACIRERGREREIVGSSRETSRCEEPNIFFKGGERARRGLSHVLETRTHTHTVDKGMVRYGMVWYGMVEVCEGAPMAVHGWVLPDRHDLAPCSPK